MTPLEILEAHTFGHSLLTVRGFCDGCDWHSYTGPKLAVEAHRAHLAEVLDKRMREREAEAWELGASTAWQRSSPTVNGTNYYWRSKGEPVNPHSKETFDGRE